MRVACEQWKEGRPYGREGRSSAGCGVAADGGGAMEGVERAQTRFVFSMDARHMRALSESSGKSGEITSTTFGSLGHCRFFQKRKKL